MKRFISEDTHWNTGNCIYGDKNYKENEIRYPSSAAMMQSGSLYAYCSGNPVKYSDRSGDSLATIVAALVAYNIGNPKAKWHAAALAAKTMGYKLSAALMTKALNGEKTYVSKPGGYASNLAKNDNGLSKFVNDKIYEFGTSKGTGYVNVSDLNYEIPVADGDLGAALHWVKVDITAVQQKNGIWKTTVVVHDTFDFTEKKNISQQKGAVNKAFWTLNNIATNDEQAGVLNPVNVKITYHDVF